MNKTDVSIGVKKKILDLTFDQAQLHEAIFIQSTYRR